MAPAARGARGQERGAAARPCGRVAAAAAAHLLAGGCNSISNGDGRRSKKKMTWRTCMSVIVIGERAYNEIYIYTSLYTPVAGQNHVYTYSVTWSDSRKK